MTNDLRCVCTHLLSSHNVNRLCVAVPGVLGCGCLGFSPAPETVLAYRLPYASYLLWLCLRCGEHGLDEVRQPVTEVPWLTACDRCHVPIPRGHI